MERISATTKRLATVFLCVALLFPVGLVRADGPVILSRWIVSPPSIDGLFQLGEWSAPQIIINGPIQTFVYFMNDQNRLCVLVDATGDVTDDLYDDCLLWFNANGTTVALEIYGTSGTTHSIGFSAAIGYASSPDSASSHKIYEWSIPFTYIGAQPCQPIRFCSPPVKSVPGFPVSMPYDEATGYDNVWPPNLNYTDLNTWATIRLDCGVGGEILPTNTLSLLAPYALMAVSAAAGLFAIRRNRIRF